MKVWEREKANDIASLLTEKFVLTPFLCFNTHPSPIQSENYYTREDTNVVQNEGLLV